MAREDREQLDLFLDDLQSVLYEVVHQRTELLPADLRASYAAAFRQVELSIRATRDALLLPPPPADYPGAPETYGEVSDEDLERAGLTGEQLGLKIRGWQRALGFFRRSPVRRALRRVFRWGNVLLGSLAGVIGAAELVKEFKEAVEAGVEETEEEPPEQV